MVFVKTVNGLQRYIAYISTSCNTGLCIQLYLLLRIKIMHANLINAVLLDLMAVRKTTTDIYVLNITVMC